MKRLLLSAIAFCVLVLIPVTGQAYGCFPSLEAVTGKKVPVLSGPPISTLAQEKDRWQRLYTGEDSVIDVNVSSLTLDVGQVLRARFRTTLSKAESLMGKSETKYKSRLETIEFKLRQRRYRLTELVLLDSSGKEVPSNEAQATEDWKVLKEGGMMQRLFDATRLLPPFGNWKVVGYRLAEDTSDSAPDFKMLVGTRVRVTSDRVEVGMKACSSPAYQSRAITDKEFSHELGVSLASVGVRAKQAETIVVKCESNEWAPPQSLLVKTTEGGMLLLWKGIFLVLKKEPQRVSWP